MRRDCMHGFTARAEGPDDFCRDDPVRLSAARRHSTRGGSEFYAVSVRSSEAEMCEREGRGCKSGCNRKANEYRVGSQARRERTSLSSLSCDRMAIHSECTPHTQVTASYYLHAPGPCSTYLKRCQGGASSFVHKSMYLSALSPLLRPQTPLRGTSEPQSESQFATSVRVGSAIRFGTSH